MGSANSKLKAYNTYIVDGVGNVHVPLAIYIDHYISCMTITHTRSFVDRQIIKVLQGIVVRIVRIGVIVEI